MLKLRCKKHPKYKAKHKPRAKCDDCIMMSYIATVYKKLVKR